MERNNNKIRAGCLKLLLTCGFALATSQAFAAGVELDGASNTGIDQAPNGVPVVNIARPNSRGLSHNTYRKFDVDPAGLILNNSNRTVVNTRLGGQILGNSRLHVPARVILNEVTSANRSHLRGYTEVAGQEAEVVIANPNGISVNGAGFINTPRVTLTTGRPQIDTLGNLDGFDVRGGDIAVEGDGLNSEAQDVTSIYTHYLTLNAKLHARDLDVVLGDNTIDYPGRKIVRVGKSGRDRVVLDSSALGGMYAGKISLVGTDQGLGMNLPPEVIASSGNIEISNAGRLVLQKVDAGGSLRVRSNDLIESSDTVYSARDIEVETAGGLVVQSGMIGAAESVSIEADRVDNEGLLIVGLDAYGSFNEQGKLSIHSRELLNLNEIIATDSLQVQGDNIVNRGLFNANNLLQIEAGDLRNEATLFSAYDAELLLQTSLVNTSGSAIFALNDLLLAADWQGARTKQITNELGHIQTLQGDIDIHAQRFENLGEGDLLYDLVYYDLGKGREVSTPSAAMTIDLAYSSGYTKHRSKARQRWVREVLRRLSRQAPLLYADNANDISSKRSARFLAIETRLVDRSITDPAFLDSGNDLNLNVGEFLNQNSVTAAARDINFSISGDYRNQAISATEKVTHYQYAVRASHKDNWKDEDQYTSVDRAGYIPISRNKTVSTNTVTQAGRNVSGEIGGQAVNSGVLIGTYQSPAGLDPTGYSVSGIQLPKSDFGLFVQAKAPDSQFLIETNPRFTQLGNFISSKYLLDRMDFSGSAELKRLGDAFYESMLIRDAVFAQSGRRFLEHGIQNDNQQFQYLMDNALLARSELELAPGIALRPDQINRLTRDIVWLEAQEIDGERVLVPKVYLASGSKAQVRGGQILSTGDTRLVVSKLQNEGLIEAIQNLRLESRNEILNRGELSAGDRLELEASGDIENVSGRIAAREVTIRSHEGDIVNRRETAQYSYTSGDLNYSTTQLGTAASIEAGDRLLLEAAGSIEITASNISGGDINLDADKVEITASAVDENYFAGNEDNHVHETSTRHFASSIDGNDIVILSRGASRVEGSRLDAKGVLRIAAGSIDIDAVNDSEYYASRETEDKTLGESVKTVKSFSGKNVASELIGATVVLVTEKGDIEISGSKVLAANDLVMGSHGDIRIQAGHDSGLEESHEYESGWFSGGALYAETENLEGKVTRAAVKSRVEAENLEISAQDDVELAGVDIRVEGSMSAIADEIAVRNTSDEIRTYSKHTKITVGLDDLSIEPGAIDDLVEVDDGKLKLQLGNAEYENLESATRKTIAVASQIEAGSIRLEAGQSVDSDISIEGSNIEAEQEITLNAGGDIEILDARHEIVTEDLTQKGSAVVNWTLQNEYEQVNRAIKAVREAERELRHARDDYEDYKEELKSQHVELDRLEQQYASGTGFIERADINEFKRYLARLQDDEEFYQSNIALATATLASKTTALIQQTGRAASSSATYGFNMGIELDIDALENRFDEYYRESMASNLAAERINIRAGDDARIRGSNLLAGDNLDISAERIDIEAGLNSRKSTEREQQVDLSYSWDLMGDSSSADPKDLGGSISGNGRKTDSESRTFTNAQLIAGDLSLSSADDTSIGGADLTAIRRLEIESENLEVSSVQDISWSDSRSQGLSYSRAGAGVNASEGYSEAVKTRVTRLTGQQVEIGVADHIDLHGAVVAAVDENGIDNGQLKLTTETLSASSMNNMVDSNNRSLAIFGGETSTLDFSNDAVDSKTRSLATLGSGDIQIGDTEGSDTRFLNTKIDDTEVSIFDIDSHQGLSGELDVRLLSAEGRRQVAEDWLKTGMLGNTLKLIATTERVGLEDFFRETDKTNKTYEAVKQQIASDPGLAQALQNPALTAEQKASMLDQLTDAVMRELGYETYQNKVVDTFAPGRDNEQVNGFYSRDTGEAYINDRNIENTEGLVRTAGHEATRAMDHQDGSDLNENRDDRRKYAENYGQNLATYTGHALEFNGYDEGLADTNHHMGNDSSYVDTNNRIFDSLDKSNGDNYLNHQESLRYNLVVDALFDCGAGQDCSKQDIATMQQEVAQLLKQDRATDARLKAACQDASSEACRAEISNLKDAFNTYKNLPGIRETVRDGTFSDYIEVATLYGEYQSQAMSDNAKRALVSIPVDTVTGTADLLNIATRAVSGDQEAQRQLSAISEGIQAFILNPVDTVAQNVKAQLAEADKQEALGNINKAQEIRSKVIIEGAFAITATSSGAISLVRTGISLPNPSENKNLTKNSSGSVSNDDPAQYPELAGTGADASRVDLPENYVRVVAPDGEIVIKGPRNGIYEATDFVDKSGNPLYINNNKLYSFDGEKEYVRVQQVGKNSDIEIPKGGGDISNKIAEAIVGLQSNDKGIESKFAEKVAIMSTHTMHRDDRVVIGKWEQKGGYIGEALEHGGVWFETPPEFFDLLSSSVNENLLNKKAWVVNQKFLELQLKRGVQKIELVGESIQDVLINRPDSYTAREIKFIELNAKKYGYKRRGNTWIKMTKN